VRFVQQGSGLYTAPPQVQGNLVVNVGESNTYGAAPGLAGNTTGIQYWDTDVTGLTSSFWHALHGTSFHPSHGVDRSFGAQLLAAAGYSGTTAMLTVAYGSTSYPNWLPGDPKYTQIKTAIQNALALLPAAFPNVNAGWRTRQVRNSGTTDMLVNDLAYQQGWAAAQATWSNALVNDIVKPVLPDAVWSPTLYVQSCSDLFGAFFVSTGVIPQQYTAAGDLDHIIDADALQYDALHKHMTQTGYIDLGNLLGTQLVFLDTHGL
jgi:hypothetical protein